MTRVLMTRLQWTDENYPDEVDHRELEDAHTMVDTSKNTNYHCC